jgi:Fe-S-cluster-containing dehydrogenase component
MNEEKDKKFGMVIDLDKCTGCGACAVACMSENNVGVLQDETNKIRSITWLRDVHGCLHGGKQCAVSGRRHE